MPQDYSNREIDLMLKDIHEKLDLILTQTTRHNGRLTKVEDKQRGTDKVLIIVGCIVGTLLITSGSELIDFVLKLI
jgi:hypothetical protein